MSSLGQLAVAVCALWGATGAAQEIYRYVEADGTIVYTNVPPPGARRATRVKGSFKPAERPTAPPAPRAQEAGEYDDLIEAASARYRIPSALVRAIVHAESNYDPTALSPRGAWEVLLDSGLSLELGRGDVAPRLERFVAAWPGLAARGVEAKHADLRYANGFALRLARREASPAPNPQTRKPSSKKK